MIISAIISEFNPIHSGHEYLIKKTRNDIKSDAIVAIMSGNFVQRGEPAFIDKYIRAKMAILSGIDLVIELPVVFSTSSAENFAFGAIKCLNSLSVIDFLSFGSESGDLEFLSTVSDLLNNETSLFKAKLKEYLSTGLSFAKSRSNAIHDFLNIDFNGSNDILAVEYLKALYKTDSKIVPSTIKRLGENYNSTGTSGIFLSATGIRSSYVATKSVERFQDKIPFDAFNLLNQYLKFNDTSSFDDMYPFIKYKTMADNQNCFKDFEDVDEGLDNLLFKSIINSDDMNYILKNSKSKRYALSRIKRILTKFFLNIKKSDLEFSKNEEIKNLKILAFNEKGREVLKKIKVNSDVNMLTKYYRHFDDSLLNHDLIASKCYSLINKSFDPLSDFSSSSLYIK